MANYILLAHREPTANRDVWLVQNTTTGEYVFRSFNVQLARQFVTNLEAAK